jgi:hypothetical protein
MRKIAVIMIILCIGCSSDSPVLGNAPELEVLALGAFLLPRGPAEPAEPELNSCPCIYLDEHVHCPGAPPTRVCGSSCPLQIDPCPVPEINLGPCPTAMGIDC